jgi:hypothetical protein
MVNHSKSTILVLALAASSVVFALSGCTSTDTNASDTKPTSSAVSSATPKVAYDTQKVSDNWKASYPIPSVPLKEFVDESEEGTYSGYAPVDDASAAKKWAAQLESEGWSIVQLEDSDGDYSVMLKKGDQVALAGSTGGKKPITSFSIMKDRFVEPKV